MRRLVGWIGGALGGLTAYRLLRRRPQAVSEDASVEPDARADELRAKIAESRTAEEPVPQAEVSEDPAPESPEERRRRVHEEGRAALDEMRPE